MTINHSGDEQWGRLLSIMALALTHTRRLKLGTGSLRLGRLRRLCPAVRLNCDRDRVPQSPGIDTETGTEPELCPESGKTTVRMLFCS
ncbi:hypothetical protein GWI33_019779 [Rhynchophorus ferrugineus]|uniref:Uncharacterized protein n=1 Tax=Rhynchophorus ferrugineus TaxID=354439 RepID=A0A834HTQ5_RHYFE|nr:hypothetical protein GWI33_019779 [Rhynchophorus ferrugineus]